MAEETNRWTSKKEKLLKKVLAQQFRFETSPDDLTLLRSIHEGTYANAKPGDPSFHAYAAAVNTTSEFATQALDILELIPFNNQLADLQEEHIPSYPPMSPITTAFWASWMVLDAYDSFAGATLGGLLAQYLQHKGSFDCLRQALIPLNDSFCSFYEVTDVDAHGVTLWDIAGRQELECWNSSGYAGCEGEVWYVRLLPPYVKGSNRWVTVSTPYVFTDGNRSKWEAFFQRYVGSKYGASHPLQDYLKYGKSLGYWLEFLFQAYTGCTGNMIRLTGVPDGAVSLPHSDPRHKL